MLDERALAREIADMRALIDATAPDLVDHPGPRPRHDAVDDPLFPHRGLGGGATAPLPAPCSTGCGRATAIFAASRISPHVKFAFTNYGVSIGLQAVNAMTERVSRLNAFFEHYRSGDEYDREAITHVMACSSHFPGYLIRGFSGLKPAV